MSTIENKINDCPNKRGVKRQRTSLLSDEVEGSTQTESVQEIFSLWDANLPGGKKVKFNVFGSREELIFVGNEIADILQQTHRSIQIACQNFKGTL
jgi:hypothetical protein